MQVGVKIAVVVGVLVPVFLIAVALIVVFVVCRRKAAQEKRAEFFLTSDDLGNDTVDTGLTNEHAIVDIKEKEVAEVYGLEGPESAGSKDPGHGGNGPSAERLSSNGSLRGEGEAVVGCTEVDVIVQNEEGDCAVVTSPGKQDKECDIKLVVKDETDAGVVGDRDDGLGAGKNSINENSVDDIGGEALEGTVPVSKNSTVNRRSQDSGVKDSELGKEIGIEVESRNVLTEEYRGQCRFVGNYETIGEEQFGEGGEKEDVGLGIECDNLPVRDLAECGEHVKLEDNYATIGGDVGVGVEVGGAGRENANLAVGLKTGGVGWGRLESDYCEVGADELRGMAKKKDTTVVKKKAKKEKKERKGISLKHFKRPKGSSHLGTSGHKSAEEPTYAVVDLEKKKRSRSEKAPTGGAGVAKLKVDAVCFSDDTDLYDRLDRNRAWSKSSVGQGNNYDKVEPQGPGSDVTGGKKTVWVVTDTYSPTPPDWQRKGSVAVDHADKNGVSDEAHDKIASYSDAKKCKTKDLDAWLEEGQQEPGNGSCEGQDAEIVNLKAMYHNSEVELDSKADDGNGTTRPPAKQDGGSCTDDPGNEAGNDAPEENIDPDYASVNNSEAEDEEDHYATVGDMESKEEHSSGLSSRDEVHIV